MRSFIKVSQLICMASFASILYTSLEASCDYAANPKAGVTSSGALACVWESYDQTTNQSFIKGSYGSDLASNVVQITDSALFSAYSPKISVSTSGGSVTKAVAAWMARDKVTNNLIIQTTVLTALGWNQNPKTLSNNDGSEKPNNDYDVSISPDGYQIMITWSTLTSNGENVLRYALSSDGGLTWSSAKDPNTSKGR